MGSVGGLAVLEAANAIIFGIPPLASAAPRGLACPFAAGAYCLLNGDMGGHAPGSVLVSLVVLQVMAAEAWCAPLADVQTLCLELGLHRMSSH